MIYTVTLNPAVDYIVRLDAFADGTVNRSLSESIQFGGKGINVSTVLTALGIRNTALGFVAGFTGRALDEGLRQMGVDTRFIVLPSGMTRINVKIKAQQESEINGNGPRIDLNSLDRFYYLLSSLVPGDYLILAGSIPPSLPQTIYRSILERLSGRNIRVMLDTEGEALLCALSYRPFLIKPNRTELRALTGRPCSTDADVQRGAAYLQRLGARNVLVSLAGDGAVLLDETGELHRMRAPSGTVRNSVGAGDSMLAGFLAGLLQNGTYSTALRLGVAAGSATAFSEKLADRASIIRLFNALKI